MIIIETCPMCGHDLTDTVLAVYPPIHKKECFNCGWGSEGQQEEVVRIPFGEEVVRIPFGGKTNFAPNATNFTPTKDYLNNFNFKDARVGNFEQSACDNCSNNPKNGGNGICNCTFGLPKVTC